MNKLDDQLNRLALASLYAIGSFLFVSFSLTAAHHIFLLVPGLFYLSKDFKSATLNAKVFAVLIGVLTLSIFFNWSEFESPFRILLKQKYYIFGLAGIFAFQRLLDNGLLQKHGHRLFLIFITTTSVATVSGLIGLMTGFNPLRFKEACNPVRNCGMYGMLMSYSYGVAMFSCLILGAYFYRKELKIEKYSLWIVLALVINIVGMYLSYSRGAFIGFLAGCIVLAWFKNKKFFLGTIMTVVLFFGVATYLKSNNVLELRYGNYSIDNNSIDARIGQYQAAWAAWKENPILGMGMRRFESQSVLIKKKYDINYLPEFGGHAHSNYFELLVGGGSLGFIVFMLWLFLWLKVSLTSKHWYPKLFAPFVVCFSVSGLFQSTIIDGENLFLIMTVYALSQINFHSSLNKKTKSSFVSLPV